MGKAGKARKKQKLLALAVKEEDLDDSDGDGDGDGGGGGGGGGGGDDLDTAISVLNTLSTRLSVYDSKAMKPLRISLFPLIQRQLKKFFEDPPPPPVLSDEEVSLLLAPTSIATTLRVTRTLTEKVDSFSSLEFKEFRRALHPFVLYQLRKRSADAKAVPSKPTTDKIRPAGWSKSVSSRLPIQSTELNPCMPIIEDKKKQSLSNRVAYYYRMGDWTGALCALHELRMSSDMPKLGSLQRWVRESDVETFQMTSMKPAAVSHVPSNPAQSLSSYEIVPSYAMGNNFRSLVSKLSADELSRRVMSQRLLYAVLNLMRTKLQDSITTAKRKRAIRQNHFEEHISYNSEQFVNLDVECIHYPVFHALSSENVFNVSNATEALQYLEVFQSVYKLMVPVLSPSFMDKVSVVFNIPGPERRPPSAHDLNIYYTLPCAFVSSSNFPVTETITVDFRLSEEDVKLPSSLEHTTPSYRKQLLSRIQQSRFYLPPSPEKHDILNVPGAFMLTDVLSPLECCQLMTMAETLRYTPDAVFGIDNVIWLGNESFMSLLSSRVEPLIPSELNGRKFAGINARLRLFRYFAGAVYRPHIDGAWPGSGLTTHGEFTDDAFSGDRHSQLTFLVYLNDGFDGGTTTFFLAGKDDCDEGVAKDKSTKGVIESRGVKPRQGSVLCFPHGHAMGSLVHEGSAVANGVKYVIRSDVLYYV